MLRSYFIQDIIFYLLVEIRDLEILKEILEGC